MNWGTFVLAPMSPGAAWIRVTGVLRSAWQEGQCQLRRGRLARGIQSKGRGRRSAAPASG